MEDLVRFASEQPLGIFLLIVGVFAFATERVVPKKTHEREVARGDRFEGLTLRLLQVADATLGLVPQPRAVRRSTDVDPLEHETESP